MQLVYKPDSQSTDEFIVIIGDEVAAKKWIDGDKTIPLVDIVDSFDIFHTGQGSQGLLERASKQELDTVFGSAHHDDIIPQMLEKGRLIQGHAPTGYGSKNSTNSGSNQTSRGAVGGGR